MTDKTIPDHINPTEREAALIEQYNKALATVASVAKERDAANRDAKATIISLNEASKFAAESILKLTNERDEFHRCLLAREGTLKAEGDRWVKAMTERDEARAALQQAQAGWATLKQMAKDADGCEAFRLALLQIVDLSEHGKAILARFEALELRTKKAEALLMESADLINDIAAYGNCDCDIPKGFTCVTCEAAIKTKLINTFLAKPNE